VAALFLREFVNAGAAAAASTDTNTSSSSTPPAPPQQEPSAARAAPAWMHIDTGAWVAGGAVRAGRTDGGEALGLLALTAMLHARYSGSGAAAAAAAAAPGGTS